LVLTKNHMDFFLVIPFMCQTVKFTAGLVLIYYNQDLVKRFCLSEKILPLYSISSDVHPVMGPKGPAIAVHDIHPPGFRSFLDPAAFRHGPKQGSLIMCPA
jgi:hypothetical protein